MSAQPSVQNGTPNLIEISVVDRIASFKLNDAKTRNALSSEMMGLIEKNMLELGERKDVSVIVLEADGPVFSSGHNLKEVMSDHRKQAMMDLFNQCSQMMQTIVNLPKPVIAKVNGVATAAGCQLVASADLAFASTSSKFATPGVNLGLFCSTPMVALSRNVSPKHAMEMLLGGEFIDADHAARIGLINRAVAEEELDAVVHEFAARIASKSPLTVKTGKTAFYQQLPMSLKDAYDYASEVMADNMQTHDAQEGIGAFLEKRDPKWTGE
ncbi:enoyl-CoA hydratase [Sneathiella sp. P13V-1]|uniref:enoyl-CoA hydratase n=1 Tax=Sneathiella sp. P13V-1 TaxID=2697366 RepID=UPI00187B2FD9|nr:enoyl-CoA hydratase [Sneathiella sp. P13V-1]MBE7636947.1 enoyl-CoA hydratase [Sneathiella sp. P13V-1]